MNRHLGQRRIGHDGGWVGFNTVINRYPDIGFTIIILSNRAEFDPTEKADRIAEIYLDQD